MYIEFSYEYERDFHFIANKDVCDFSHAMYIVLFILNKMHFDLQLQCKCLYV